MDSDNCHSAQLAQPFLHSDQPIALPSSISQLNKTPLGSSVEALHIFSDANNPLHDDGGDDDENNIKNEGQAAPYHALMEDKININVSGWKYEISDYLLKKFPSSLLGNEAMRARYWCNETKSYNFDRHPSVFSEILYFYVSLGECFECPPNVSHETFNREMRFFKIPLPSEVDTTVEDPINLKYVELRKKSVQVKNIPGSLRSTVNSTYDEIRLNFWELLSKPESSKSATFFAYFATTLIIVSSSVFVIETIPEINNHPTQSLRNPGPKELLNIIEALCVIFFTCEILLRFWSCPSRLYFFSEPFNVIDILAILPNFIEIMVKALVEDENLNADFLTVLRIFRIAKIVRLSRRSVKIRLLFRTLAKSGNAFTLLFVVIAFATLLFGTLIYYAERGGNEEFKSIPHTFWYCVVTMTTVGYGDMTPRSIQGRFLGFLCALMGVFCIALPVPAIVENFQKLNAAINMESQRMKEGRKEHERKRGESNTTSPSNSPNRDPREMGVIYDSATEEKE